MISLSEFLNKYQHLRKYYEFLKCFLPNPDEIKVGNFHSLREEGVIVRETVMACAIPPNKLFFRYFPPSEYTFVHELIHLCKKYNEHEEVYAYNLADAVIYLAERGIQSIDIFKLFELSIAEIERTLREIGFESIEEFYKIMGIIPLTHKIEDDEIVREENITDKQVVVAFITELVAGLDHFKTYRHIFERLISLCGTPS